MIDPTFHRLIGNNGGMDQSLLHPVQRTGRDVRAVHRPMDLTEALRILVERPEAKPVAGGTDLLLDLHRGGPGEAVELVDLTHISGLDEIFATDNSITLGAMVTHNQVVRSSEILGDALPLAQACLEVASPQLRNRATVAGNIITASPANDTISALLALEAEITLARLDDSGDVTTRQIPIDEFFTGFRTTVIETGELLTTITIPRMAAGSRGMWVKLGLRRAQAISVIHMAIVIGIDGAGTVTKARVAAGSVAPRVVLLPSVTEALVGHRLDDATIAAAAEASASAVRPIDDVRATADYRKQTIRTITSRTLATLRDNRQAEMWQPDPPCLADAQRSPAAPSTPDLVDDTTPITVTVNGNPVTAAGAASRNLLDWLRDQASDAGGAGPLTGTKEGCAEGECGACTVRLDGQAVMSCMVPAAQAAGSTVVTVEGLASEDSVLHPIQTAFIDEFAVQCGFCIPGFLVSGSTLLDEVGSPDDDQIRLGLSGNLCRCTGYYPIIEAVRTAADAGGQP